MLSSTPGNATTTTVVTQTATATGSHSSPQSSSALFLLAASAHFAGVWARVGGWCPNPDGAPTPMVPVQGPEQPPGAVLLRRGGAPGIRARTAGPGHGEGGEKEEEEEAARETPQGHGTPAAARPPSHIPAAAPGWWPRGCAVPVTREPHGGGAEQQRGGRR